MTPERLQRVEALFHAALERTPDARRPFLADACAGDSDLRREVESLLGQQDGTLLHHGLAAAAAVVTPAASALVGRELGPYVIGPLIGRGGMGDVYRARDTRLERDVAVKIVPASFGRSPERLARFEREARALAALNHPHIATIHGIEESGDLRGLVLELVDGVTLEERLAGGAMPVDEALACARQIADALAAAHQKGIVHRDLKPGNIKITAAGTIKVLDFGLAKIDAPDAGEGQAARPVQRWGQTPGTPEKTTGGVILGTVAYMSPEQARGRSVDRRTDIWAFGCVLFEMLTGARPFAGDTATDVLGAITRVDPDWGRLPADTPPRVRDLLRRCLAKDRDRRLHDAADARLEIEDALASPVRSREWTFVRARRLGGGVLGALAALALVLAAWLGATPSGRTGRSAAHVAIPLPPGVAVYGIGRGSSVAISPDGQQIVYAGVSGGRRQLYLRRLDGAGHVPLAGTDNAANPFFSPDGEWIGFTDGPQGPFLKKLSIGDGRVYPLGEFTDPGGRRLSVQSASWGSDETILFASIHANTRGIWRVPAAGGTPVRITAPRAGELTHAWPQSLHGGAAVLYTTWTNTGFHGGRVVVQRLPDGEPRVLVERASHARVVSRDARRAWLVYAQAEGLRAAPFDVERLELTGPAAAVQDGVLVNLSGGAHFSVSPAGLLAFVPGGLDEASKTAVWVTPHGVADEIGTIPGLGFQYRLSPDGRRLARPNAVGPTRDIWVDDLARRGTPTRLTSGRLANAPVWTPDGRRVIYSSGAPRPTLFWRMADGTGEEEPLTTSGNAQVAGSVSPDGTTLAYTETSDAGAGDIWLLPLQGARRPRLFLGTQYSEMKPAFSPDGRWIAYQSNVSGEYEIYIARAEGGGAQLPVSQGGGWHPIWARDGQALYYRTVESSQGGEMMVAPIDAAREAPQVGPPRLLFPSPYQGDGDLAPDGRFLLLRPTPQTSPSPVIGLVLNWFDELQATAPVD